MDESVNNEENKLPPGMDELERDNEDDIYDVNSLEIQSRSDGSIALALDFHPGFSASQRTSHGRKSLNTRKSGTKSKRSANVVKTRAPPKKSYEPAPFLLIDNLTDGKSDRTTNTGKKDTPKSLTTSYSQSLTVPRNTPTPTPTGRTTSGFQRIGSGRTLSCSSSEWNKLVPRKSRALYKQVTQRQPNQHVQSPFKHTASSSVMERSVVMPDQKLKELTVLATYEVAKAIAKQQPEVEHKIQGRLLKARLKPLNTVNISGPSINQCRGIVAGTHSYKPSPNRTLQRRRQLLQNLNKDYMRDRPQTAESIHHTSVASDNTDARDQEELDYLLLASASIDDHEAQVFGIPPNSLASLSEATAHQVSHSVGQDIAEFPGDESISSNNVTARDQKPDKVEEVGSEDDPDIQEVAEAEKYFLESDDDAKRSTDNITDTPINNSNLHRPMSMHDTGLRKSVRFADATSGRTDVNKGRSHSAMPCFRQDRIPNPRNSEAAQTSKQKGRSSCRPASTEVKNSWHDDRGHDPSSGGSGTHRSGAWSVNSISTNKSTNADQNTPPKKSASDGNKDKTEVVRTSIGEVKFGFDEVQASTERSASQMGVRLRLRLGEWEDVIKPGDCGDLVISGRGKGVTERDADVQSVPYKRMGSNTQRARRPQSAKGPGEFMLEEKRQIIWRARPVSARADCLGLDTSVSTMSAVLNVRPQSAKRPAIISARPQSGKSKQMTKTSAVVSTKRPRPSSGKFKRCNSAKLQKTRSNSGHSEVKSHDGKPCSYCSQPTDKDIDYKNGSYFIVCQNCSQQCDNMETRDASVTLADDGEHWDLNANEVAKCLANEMLQRRGREVDELSTGDDNNSTTVGSYQGMQYGRSGSHGSTVIYSATNEDHSVNKASADVVESPDVNASDDPQSNGASCGPEDVPIHEGQILSNLDDLEKSLADVQTEIKDCLRQTRCSGDKNEDAVADDSQTKTTSTSECIESELSINREASQNNREGAFSTKLIGEINQRWETVENNIRVYQFVEKDTDTKKHNGNLMRNAQNDISTYEATMVSPLKPSNGTQSTQEMFSTQLQEPVTSEQKNVSVNDNSASQSGESSLEVRATAKSILKQMSDDGAHPVCPHPALSFSINARPPPGFLYYFAYGMDMNPDRLSTYIHRHITERFWGLLFGFRLLFNKKGVDEEAGGFPNIELCDNSSVEGCLQLITPTELNLLDKYFGYPELNCPEADELGVAQYCVPAVMYVAKDRWTHRGDPPLDSSYAADQCLKGTTFLSPEYSKRLHQYRDLT